MTILTMLNFHVCMQAVEMTCNLDTSHVTIPRVQRRLHGPVGGDRGGNEPGRAQSE